jgi:O-antigen/teichoic acid export membrane protein
MARFPTFDRAWVRVARDFVTAMSGSVGRLVFSLLYFVALANALSISDFGLFATASAAGVMLSRILGFGFVSALYRIATVKPNLVGVFVGGFLMMAVLSLPVLALAAWATYLVFFAGELPLYTFALVIVAEAILWRPAEAIVIVNNGLNRFGRASILVILGTLLRSVAAVALFLAPAPDLATWVPLYLAANALTLAIAIAFFHPRRRVRFRPALYWRRLADSIYVAGAELLFYLQMEMDKLLVLALGGPQLAGIYAIIMRLVDLTAIPIRTFTMLLVQRMMRTPHLLASLPRRIGFEAGVFVVSTIGIAMLAAILHLYPNLLGRNVSEAAPLVALALFIPGLRNLMEYQAELLYARGQTLVRAVNLAMLAGYKALLLAWLLALAGDTESLVMGLNYAFLGLYLASAALTYSAMRMPARRI